MKTCRRLLTAIACMAATTAATAQKDTPDAGRMVTTARMVAVGATDILDTYLSQEKYKGTEVRYMSHSLSTKPGSNLSRLIIHQGMAAFADNRSGNGGEMEGMYNFQYGWLYNWRLYGGRLRVTAGATADATAGFLYNTHGSNNPAQARLNINITPTASAAYTLRWGNTPLTISYELAMPLAGMMFSPNYGQSYYEIFSRGNYDHNIVPTYFGNAPSMRNMLTIDIGLGSNALRIGYLGDIRQAKPNSLKQHKYTHAFLIGFIRTIKTVKVKAGKFTQK